MRDVNLSDKLDKKYVENMIILEHGFTDASSKVGGILTTHRFAILSNHMADFSDYEQGTDWGLFVANHSSHFLILDKYKYNAKTQIILLHLPNDKRWKLFRNAKINVLDDIVKKLRDKMEMPDEIIDSVVVHELCHKKHMNHSPEFYTEIEKVFPQYQKCHKWLKENGGQYLRRLQIE